MTTEEIIEKALESNKVIGWADDTTIAASKAKLNVKNIHEILIVDEEEKVHAVYFKKPTISQLDLLSSYAKKSQEFKGLEVLYNTCKVPDIGSSEVDGDDELKVAAYKALAGLFKKRETAVKKR